MEIDAIGMQSGKNCEQTHGVAASSGRRPHVVQSLMSYDRRPPRNINTRPHVRCRLAEGRYGDFFEPRGKT